MITASISIDVPSLAQGLAFYEAAFGFQKTADPYPGVMILRAGDISLCLLEKAAGSKPAPNTAQTRSYERHWTPVHLDFEVDDFSQAVARAVAAGAKVEQRYDDPKHGRAAFCSDPFGHGFCLIERVR